MYAFALVILLGLAVTAMVMLFDRFLRIADELTVGVALLLGMGGAWLADMNVFAAWGFTLRAEWIAIVFTGLIVGAVGYLFHEVVGLVAGIHRKFVDEVIQYEKVHDLRRAA